MLFSLSFSADEIYDTVSGEIEKEAEFYIPEESEKTAENFGETLTKENASSFFDIKKLFSFFIKSVLSVFDEEKGMFLSLLGILVLSFFTRRLGEGLSSSVVLSSVGNTIFLFSAAAIFIPVFSEIENCVWVGEEISACALSFLPVFSAVTPSPAALAETWAVGGLVVFSTELFSFVFSSVVPVLCAVFLSAGFAAGITGDKGIAKAAATLRNVTIAAVTAFCFVVTALPSLQQGFFSGGETAVKKGLKFVLSSSVPVGGGFLSDGLDSVFSAASAVKKGCGSFFAAISVVTALLPVARLSVFTVFFKLSSSVSSAFGNTSLENFFSAAGDASAVILAFVSACFIVLSTLVVSLSAIGGGYG